MVANINTSGAFLHKNLVSGFSENQKTWLTLALLSAPAKLNRSHAVAAPFSQGPPDQQPVLVALALRGVCSCW